MSDPPSPQEGMLLLEGGEFLMGDVGPSAYAGDGERPVRRIRLDAFRIDPHAVSNAEFPSSSRRPTT